MLMFFPVSSSIFTLDIDVLGFEGDLLGLLKGLNDGDSMGVREGLCVGGLVGLFEGDPDGDKVGDGQIPLEELSRQLLKSMSTFSHPSQNKFPLHKQSPIGTDV